MKAYYYFSVIFSVTIDSDFIYLFVFKETHKVIVGPWMTIDETSTDKDSNERCVIGIEMKKLKRLSKYKKTN